MEPESETLARALAGAEFEPRACARLRDLLAGVDLAGWFATVDDSAYTLQDWLRALLVFDAWLDGRGVAAPATAAMLGYLECCTLTLSGTLPAPAFSDLLVENLDRYGFDAAKPALP